MKACQVIPNQNIKIINPPKTTNSFEDRSTGNVRREWVDDPNRTFIQLRKKKVGPIKYSSTINTRHNSGNRSKKKLKKRISATNITDPGNPRKIRQFTNPIKNNFGQRKFKPLTSVIKRVLNRRPMASTSRKELVDKRAWLINIQKLASIRADWPLIIQIVSQCISTTVE